MAKGWMGSLPTVSRVRVRLLAGYILAVAFWPARLLGVV
jgi:hypothetical protein